MAVKPDCCVCGKDLKRACKCPWDRPFNEWPAVLGKTLGAMVAGGSGER